MFERLLGRRTKIENTAQPKPDRAIAFHTTSSLYVWYENGRLIRHRMKHPRPTLAQIEDRVVPHEIGTIDEIQYYRDEPVGETLSFEETWLLITPDGRPGHPAVLFIGNTTNIGPTSQLVSARRITSDAIRGEIEDFARSKSR